MKYYIDTNIFIYSTNPSDSRYSNCKTILEKIITGEIEALTSVETFEEIIHYGQKNKVVRKTILLCQKLLTTNLNIVSFTNKLLLSYLKIVKRYSDSKVDSRDLIHVVSALKNDAEIIISADRDFDKITEIKRIDPFEFKKN
ncbi:hypothetical protein A3A54_00290 [Candidatus Curtissbacteria bacterium RIFCSPLOWO2_01_FULL_39_62]|uniref:PIN domain-containing protein n=2 Tax=Candidatus Curtissiibacteriota TaxID=1752717 RepID=A0A1F5GAU2_9BACT|nr:MAG: hypothetical protein A2775_00790 [Candidatus Curtissbacteria bacterium RIFCSPHIGHO2_01_FULL_39_57]OGD88954.1 MAG: hypothetical protein A3D04_02040 [Candidatus Curtissbacteria bacterium RIFCSPHIGHO2_02_FULL_40_16b]OGD90704.1 MAG: hypothetical protein A3E11_01035 [Candidatus Curtissbacteria bacterium RIFCSPHIGHO2_12_FULL_38_37]OGE00707.1 MAG: hypothetical protein A3J17_04095 [Candidatus Curtissbacteria bacterium RIFCSPLOWO2_02_FULL_40_11]OGE02453.1 MAG: hypothetical protein A3A54_00290 [C